jgi:hypothetical protein
MDTNATLKRMRLQIKHGRTEGVEKKLEEMLSGFKGTEDEISVLEVYALEYLPSVGLYQQAIPLLERILTLQVKQETRSRAVQLLEEFRVTAAMMPSELALNSPAVVDFLQFIRSDSSLFFSPDMGDLDHYEIVRDIDIAKKLAWHQGIGAPFKSWNGLRETAAGDMNTYADENKINVEAIDLYRSEIAAICDRKLSPAMRNFYDDVLGDLYEILLGEALGYLPDLYKKIRDAYRVDVFPCGWKGEYPEGVLCVLIP